MIAREVHVTQTKLVILIARFDDLTDPIHLDLIAPQVQGHEFCIFVQSFTNCQCCLFSKVAASHAQMSQSLALMHE